MKHFFISLFILFTSISLFSQTNINGVWKGELSMMGSVLDIYYTIEYENGNYFAFIDVPKQGLRHFPMDSVYFDGLNLKLVNNTLKASYTGFFTMNTFVGNFIQNGMDIPVSLIRGEIPVVKRPQTPIPPFPYKEEEVHFGHLAGTLTLPTGNGPFPAVVMISGSGLQNRDEEVMSHKPFMVIADYLTKNGIAVLRYDDRSVGESKGSAVGATSLDFAEDAKLALNYLKSRKEIGEVGLCGHSEGGMIAFIIASNSPEVSFVVSMAGTALPGSEILISQQKAIAKASNIPEEYIQEGININKRLYEIVNNHNNNDDLLKDTLILYLKSIKSIKEDNINEIVKELTNPWMYYFITHNPYNDIIKIKVPILAINGTMDTQVVSTLNLPAILKAASHGGNKNITIKYLNGLNHLFQKCTTGSPNEYAQIEETISEEALEMIKDWILITTK